MSHQFWIQVYSEKSWKNFLDKRSFYKYNVLEYISDGQLHTAKAVSLPVFD
jgi:hypothetical protein